MYEGCFRQTRISKILNVSINWKTQLGISCKTCDRDFEMISQAFETLSQAFEIPDWDFETLSQAFDGLRENLAESLYYNASHAVPINHGSFARYCS